MIVGLGIDAVTSRVPSECSADKPERMLERLFGETERAYLADSKLNPPSTWPCGSRQRRRVQGACGKRARAGLAGATWEVEPRRRGA
jgi:hypothetical protein